MESEDLGVEAPAELVLTSHDDLVVGVVLQPHHVVPVVAPLLFHHPAWDSPGLCMGWWVGFVLAVTL